MKIVVLFLLLAIAFSYDRDKAVEYAKKHCDHYNSHYHNYATEGGDCANFVSQCLKAGGLDLSKCSGHDSKGSIPGVANLKSCLKKKGWKSSSSRPKSFKAGYPVFVKKYSHAMIASHVSDGEVRVCSHTKNRCNTKLDIGVTYFYL